METIILSGDSKSNAKLIFELVEKLDFSVKKISTSEAKEIGLYYSIKEGMESGLMVNEEKQNFIYSLEKS